MKALDPKAIASHFGGDVTGRQQVNIPTPGHSKRDRGTSITLKPDAPDGVVVHCHNGSPSDALAVKDQLRNAGFLPKFDRAAVCRDDDLIPTRTAEVHAVHLLPGQRIVATFDYIDLDGHVRYRTHRIEPGRDGTGKEFRYDRPAGGTWLPGLGDELQLPYGLASVALADGAADLYLVEGERKADKLISWGLQALSLKNIDKWFDRFAGFFAGRRVFILPDNDDAGDRYAVKAAELVGPKASIVRLPGLGAGGDILDWHGGPEDLADLHREIGGEALLPTLDLAALARKRAEPKAFAIERIAPLGEVTTLNGPGSAGKSLLGQQIATSAAAGLSCLGLEIRPSPALYLTCEDDDDQLHFRQERLCEALRVSMGSLAGKLHLSCLRGMLGNELATFGHDGKMTPTKTFDRLADTIRSNGVKLAVLDNVAHLFAGNENDRADVTRFVNLLNKLAGETGAAIILLGHPNKRDDEYSGSTAWSNAVRSRLYLEHDETTDRRTLTLPKANYSQKGEVVSFRWVDWAFMCDNDIPDDRREAMDEVIRANAENAAFLACLDVRNEQERPVSESPASRTYAPKEFATMSEAKGFKKHQLEAAMDRLFRAGEIEIGLVCRTGRKDRFGLRRKCADLCADPALTPCADPALTPRRPAPTHTPYTTYNPGAALEPAAPEGDRE